MLYQAFVADILKQSSHAMYWELLEMFRKLSMAAIGELCFDAQRNCVADCRLAQGFLLWMVLSMQPSLQTSLALWRPWFSRSLDSSSQARSLC